MSSLAERKIPRINLTTFLANDVADSVTKATKLARYAEAPGGADYYWALKLGAEKIIVDGLSYDEAVGVMGNMTVPHQRADNQIALKAVYDWKLKANGIGTAPPMGEIAGPLGQLKVKLEPAFGLKRGKRFEAYVLWTYKHLRLTNSVAGMGVHLLELGLQKPPFEEWRFYILDVVTGARFGHGAIGKTTAIAVHSALTAQEQLYVTAKEAAA